MTQFVLRSWRWSSNGEKKDIDGLLEHVMDRESKIVEEMDKRIELMKNENEVSVHTVTRELRRKGKIIKSWNIRMVVVNSYFMESW